MLATVCPTKQIRRFLLHASLLESSRRTGLLMGFIMKLQTVLIAEWRAVKNSVVKLDHAIGSAGLALGFHAHVSLPRRPHQKPRIRIDNTSNGSE